MQLSRHSAQQIVEQIGKLVRQNINLMDESGHIIASTDRKRIGSFHQGAYRIISERLPELYVTPEMETPSVRQGINLPLEVKGNVVGVIGITGGYQEVFAYGQIVKKMTEILIAESWEQEQQRLDNRVLTRFLEEWVLGTGMTNPQTLSDRGFALGIDIRTPRRVIVVSIRDVTAAVSSLQGQMLIQEVEKTVANCAKSWYGTIFFRNAARQILLLPKRSEGEIQRFVQKITDTVYQAHGVGVLLGIDGQAADIHTAYLQANRAWSIAAHRKSGIACYSDLRAELILDDISAAKKAEYLRRIFPEKKPEQIREYIALLSAYFSAEGSLQEAAEALFIHKNTLQYRLRRLAEETGLDVRKPSQAPSLYLATLFYLDLDNAPGAFVI